jgi:hypothetical protein
MARERALLKWMAACAPWVIACSESQTQYPVPAAPGGATAGATSSSAGGSLGVAGKAGAENIPTAPVPTDERPAVDAPTPPPPVSGGNLLVTHDGAFAVVADADRDRLVVVDTASSKVVADLALTLGDEPGRLVEDAAGRVHVALRRGGAVVTLDLSNLKLVERREACGGPRGIAYDDEHGNLLVACADGKLVTLPSAGGAATGSVFIGPDLRDVIVNASGLWVSTFKSAQLLRVDDGKVGATFGLPPLTAFTGSGSMLQASFEPEVAWHAAAHGSKILLLHQAAQVDAIELVDPAMGVGGDSGTSGSPYGSGQCSAVVRATLSQVDADGTTWTSGTLGMGTLPVDFDVSTSGQVAVAFAGSGGGRAPGSGKFMDEAAMFAVFPSDMLPADATDQGSGGPGGDSASSTFADCMIGANTAPIPEPVVALRFAPQDPNRLFLLSRNPARLYRVDGPDFGSPTVIDLGGSDVTDTGHAIFHDDAGRGIACASCHPEGTEDGHVWTFSGVGARRTQALNTDLGETAPFHWDGALADVGQLMDEVFVKRMGGEHENPDRLASLERWLFALPSLPPLRAADDAAAKRGAELFASADVACATCHAGPTLTNSKSFKVGTDPQIALQVPSLLGVSHRAPFIHTGCAATLLGRFDAGCGGGEQHGHTAQLSAGQLDDLVAYLESL